MVVKIQKSNEGYTLYDNEFPIKSYSTSSKAKTAKKVYLQYIKYKKLADKFEQKFHTI